MAQIYADECFPVFKLSHIQRKVVAQFGIPAFHAAIRVLSAFAVVKISRRWRRFTQMNVSRFFKLSHIQWKVGTQFGIPAFHAAIRVLSAFAVVKISRRWRRFTQMNVSRF